jgi:hypothetical protein
MQFSVMRRTIDEEASKPGIKPEDTRCKPANQHEKRLSDSSGKPVCLPAAGGNPVLAAQNRELHWQPG